MFTGTNGHEEESNGINGGLLIVCSDLLGCFYREDRCGLCFIYSLPLRFNLVVFRKFQSFFNVSLILST